MHLNHPQTIHSHLVCGKFVCNETDPGSKKVGERCSIEPTALVTGYTREDHKTWPQGHCVLCFYTS